MAVIGHEVRQATAIPLGIQILAGANTGALAAALACGASFVRVEGFVFAHVADEGLIESSAAAVLRYRRAIGAQHVRVFADVKKKHSAHAITADVDIVETAKAAEFFLVDGVIVSGVSTGSPRSPTRSSPLPGPFGGHARRFRDHDREHRPVSRRGRVHRRLVDQERRALVERARRRPRWRARPSVPRSTCHEGDRVTEVHDAGKPADTTGYR